MLAGISSQSAELYFIVLITVRTSCYVITATHNTISWFNIGYIRHMINSGDYFIRKFGTYNDEIIIKFITNQMNSIEIFRETIFANDVSDYFPWFSQILFV